MKTTGNIKSPVRPARRTPARPTKLYARRRTHYVAVAMSDSRRGWFERRAEMIYAWEWVIVWVALIFIASSLTKAQLAPPMGATNDIGSDALHFIIYGILGRILLYAGRESGWSYRRTVYCTVAFVALHGIFDEWHQSWVPGREVQITDWLFNMIGMGVAIVLERFPLIHRR